MKIYETRVSFIIVGNDIKLIVRRRKKDKYKINSQNKVSSGDRVNSGCVEPRLEDRKLIRKNLSHKDK